MRILVDIFKFPFLLLLFLLKTISYKILEKEFKEEREKTFESYKEIGKLKRKIEQLIEEKDQIISKYNRLKSIFKQNEYNRDVLLSNKDELIVISSSKKNFFNNWVYLCGENGKHHNNDSKINLSLYGNELKIEDFISNTNNMGYGRILLNYVIKKAFENGIETIYGNLSGVDENSFDWLIPFYKSVGFQVTMFENSEPKIIKGIIQMRKN